MGKRSPEPGRRASGAKSEIDKIIDKMTLFSNTLMQKVFDKNISATEYLLKTVLQRDDIEVIDVKGQYNMQSPLMGGRSITLDIHARITGGDRFDVEVQTDSKGSHLKRARFHSAMMDSRMLKENEDFRKIKNSYVIFIYKRDKFRKGFPVYHVGRYVEETKKAFHDGSHIIYVNGSYKGDDEIGRMIHDFKCENAEDIYNKDLAEGVKHFKETKEGRDEMKDPVEAYAEKRERIGKREGKKEGERKTLIQNIKSLMKNMNCTLEQALDALEIKGKDRAAIIGKIKS